MWTKAEKAECIAARKARAAEARAADAACIAARAALAKARTGSEQVLAQATLDLACVRVARCGFLYRTELESFEIETEEWADAPTCD